MFVPYGARTAARSAENHSLSPASLRPPTIISLGINELLFWKLEHTEITLGKPYFLIWDINVSLETNIFFGKTLTQYDALSAL